MVRAQFLDGVCFRLDVGDTATATIFISSPILFVGVAEGENASSALFLHNHDFNASRPYIGQGINGNIRRQTHAIERHEDDQRTGSEVRRSSLY